MLQNLQIIIKLSNYKKIIIIFMEHINVVNGMCERNEAIAPNYHPFVSVL